MREARRLDDAHALIGLGDALKDAGDLTGALVRFREACGIARALAGEDGLADVSAALHKIGETLIAQGDLAGGLDSLRQALEVQRRLSALDPDNVEKRRDVATSVARVGEVLTFKSALTSYRAGPDGESASARATEWQLRASWSLKTAGSALAARGDLAGALALHRECLDIRRGLLARDPDDPAALLDLAWSLMAVAGVREQQGDLAGALEACREGLAIRRALLRAQPHNDGLRRDVSVSLIAAAGLLQAAGDVAGALAAYQDARAVMHAMSPDDPAKPQWQSDLSVLEARIAAMGQPEVRTDDRP